MTPTTNRRTNLTQRTLIDSLPGFVAADVIREARAGGQVQAAESGLRNVDGSTAQGTRALGRDRRVANVGRNLSHLTDRRVGERRGR